MFMPHFLSFLLASAALALLALVTFSTPFIKIFYFLRTSEADGVEFGVFGWCRDNGLQCSPKALGIDWEPQLIPWLTKALVLYPISAGLTLLTLLSIIPLLCSYRRDRYYPTPAFTCLAFLSFLASLAAFAFMIALFAIGQRGFRASGFEASLGPSVWMSLGATGALAIVAMSSGCGCVSRGRFSRASPYLAYGV
ncbi:hypothetical protein DFH11DRAFT_1689892 [Phellopilus nigrolimitatus]|nr:hypothetical protein DFH11DRAFT_1689892 [Phellopilus nigrolimitatus]